MPELLVAGEVRMLQDDPIARSVAVGQIQLKVVNLEQQWEHRPMNVVSMTPVHLSTPVGFEAY